MKEMNCNIANDFIPLYVDDVLSEDSKVLLEEHLEHCDKCRKTVDKMKSQVTVAEDKDIKPFKKIRKKLVVRAVIIVLLVIMVVATYIACQCTWIPVKYVGDEFIADMEVVFMEDGIYVRREELSARGDVVIVDNDGSVIKFYIGENVPDHFRLAWYEPTCYTQLIDASSSYGKNIKEVDYCDKEGNVLYTLWKREE